MTNAPNFVRSLIIYGLCVPFALLLGYLLTNDIRSYSTIYGLTFVLMALLSPLLLKWHHAILVLSWNMTAIVFFLPGSPPLWLLLSAASIFLVVLRYTINQEQKIIHVPSITWSLLSIAILTFIIAIIRGGIGLRSFGSEMYGGKRYFLIWGAVLGFFALASQRIPPKRAKWYVGMFFLGGITMAIGSLLGFINERFNWIFWIFPPEYMSGLNISGGGMMRSWALPFMSLSVVSFMLAKYGLRGLTDFSRPWRFLLLLFFTSVGLLGGFRSMFVLLLLTLGVLFYLEGLMRSKLLPAVLFVTILVGALLMSGAAMYLPTSMQRSLAVLPIPIDPVARYDAIASSEWRLRMWRDVYPQVPDYLVIGKGYLFSASDAQMTMFAMRGTSGFKTSEMAGDYHNGPLSVIISFGIPGVILFLWFLIASLKALYRNYRNGPPELFLVNRFLYALFLARIIFFLAVFGSFYSELFVFTGIIGLSLALNGGVVTKPVTEEAPEPEPEVIPGVRPRPVLGFAGRTNMR
jgi:hypothetical protein